MRPSLRYCCTVSAPPAISTFRSPAAAFAWSRALWMPSVTKGKVVPPSLTRVGRGRWVRTETGVLKGGLSPQNSSPKSYIVRPMTTAPVASNHSRISSESRFSSPPVMPWRCRQLARLWIHSKIGSAPSPPGLSKETLTKPMRP